LINQKYLSGISIIICSYNGGKVLPLTLRSITDLELPKSIPTELILVDNNSTDNTPEIASMEWSRYNSPIDFKIVKQENPGLMNARSKGVFSATYDLIVFCDDDNSLHKDYLVKAWQIMNINRNIGALGGQGFAISDVEIPNWFKEVSGSYACGKQRANSGYCTERRYLWGAGLVSTKKILKKIMSTPMKLSGRRGNELLAGDDSEICLRIILEGKELYYDENLKYNHFIEANRLSLDYLSKMNKGLAKGSVIFPLYEYKIQKLRNSRIKFYWICFKDLMLILLIKAKIIKPLKRNLFNVFSYIHKDYLKKGPS